MKFFTSTTDMGKENNYGLITKKDAETLEKTLDLVKQWFKEINVLEIGVRDGRTRAGILNYLKGENVYYRGIDNNRDGMTKDTGDIIFGNSIEVYNKIPCESQSIIFLDACHNYPMTMADFLCYSDKVARFGYFAFHDTGKHIKEFTDYQGMGDRADHDMYISCRKAIKKLGLLDNKNPEWLLVFDEADETFPTGGMTVIRRI